MTTNNKLLNELDNLVFWASDVQKRLGRKNFRFKVDKRCIIERYNLSIVFFSVDCDIPSKEVKRVIREEADKYKDGRLYFMVYNDIKRLMALQFYSFFLDQEDEDCDVPVEIEDVE